MKLLLIDILVETMTLLILVLSPFLRFIGSIIRRHNSIKKDIQKSFAKVLADRDKKSQ